jgi:hypothetical protein
MPAFRYASPSWCIVSIIAMSRPDGSEGSEGRRDWSGCQGKDHVDARRVLRVQTGRLHVVECSSWRGTATWSKVEGVVNRFLHKS